MIIRTPPKITNRNSIVKYIDVDLWSWLKDLSVGILKINFQQNFQSFTVSNLLIPAGTQVSIPNGFRTSYPGAIPSARIITRQQGNATIIDGDQVWDVNYVYLQNPSGNDATISVIFFK